MRYKQFLLLCLLPIATLHAEESAHHDALLNCYLQMANDSYFSERDNTQYSALLKTNNIRDGKEVWVFSEYSNLTPGTGRSRNAKESYAIFPVKKEQRIVGFWAFGLGHTGQYFPVKGDGMTQSEMVKKPVAFEYPPGGYTTIGALNPTGEMYFDVRIASETNLKASGQSEKTILAVPTSMDEMMPGSANPYTYATKVTLKAADNKSEANDALEKEIGRRLRARYARWYERLGKMAELNRSLAASAEDSRSLYGSLKATEANGHILSILRSCSKVSSNHTAFIKKFIAALEGTTAGHSLNDFLAKKFPRIHEEATENFVNDSAVPPTQHTKDNKK